MQTFLSTLGSIGGIAGIADTIKSVAISLFDKLKEIAQIIFEKVVELAKWWLSLLTEKPEAGVTLTLIFLYLLSPY